MQLSAKRAGGDITFTAWIVGDGATAGFALFADDGSAVPGVQNADGTWTFPVAAIAVANKTAWPDAGYPVLKAITPTWLTGTPTIHLKATQAGAALINTDITGGDATLLATATVNGKTVATAFGMNFS
jgi:hypothetical protein